MCSCRCLVAFSLFCINLQFFSPIFKLIRPCAGDDDGGGGGDGGASAAVAAAAAR